MNHLSITLLFFILLQIVPNFYCQGPSYSWQTVNGVTTYYYNGQAYASKEEVEAQIARDYPGVVFDSDEPGFDIVSKFKGNNSFSNPIFDRIWEGYNFEKDSQRGFCNMKKRLLKETNEYRKAHGALPLKRNIELQEKAQKYAEYIASIEELVHDPNNEREKMGENLAYGSKKISHLAVKGWYDEIDLYDFNKPGFKKETGHFTALVWKATTKAGFGVAVNGDDVYVVCKYTSAGNVPGQYENNVLRRTD